MNTRREGSSRNCQLFQRSRRRATSRRACSSANRVFFEAEALAAQVLPHRIVRHFHTTRRKFSFQPVQRQVRGLLDPFNDKCSVRFQKPFAVPTCLARCNAPVHTVTLMPLDHRGHRNPEPFSNRAGTRPSLNGTNNTLSKIVGISSRHACWPPVPASILNHNSLKKGIPIRFNQRLKESRVQPVCHPASPTPPRNRHRPQRRPFRRDACRKPARSP